MRSSLKTETHGRYGRVVNSLSSEPENPGSSPETTDCLTNRSGQANNVLVSLFTKQYDIATSYS